MTADLSRARRVLDGIPSVRLAHYPTPVEELARLSEALAPAPRLLVKRDDAISFAFGGNKVRKMEMVAAHAIAKGADTLVTSGGVQSNHARVTAAAAAKLGLRCVLIANGAPPDRATANALLDRLLGAQVEYVSSREERTRAVAAACDRLRREGRVPLAIPIGASMPLGAAAYARAVGELLEQIPAPDAIVHSTSSGGTQAGLVAGCALHGLRTRVIGISADESSAALSADVTAIIDGLAALLELGSSDWCASVHIDDRFVGDGYGVPTTESTAAIELLARTEALFLDPTYTAKAMAGLIALVREGAFRSTETVLFWHTGGQVTLFAA